MTSRISRVARAVVAYSDNHGAPQPGVDDSQRLKYLDQLEVVIARMANNSFLFKGWSVTVAGGLAAFAATQGQRALLLIVVATTLLFWAMDAYYLWLEHGFVDLYKKAAKLRVGSAVTFNMAVDKKKAFRAWLRTTARWHLILFYGAILAVDVIALMFFKEVDDAKTYILQLQV